jgi:hypothetical protein
VKKQHPMLDETRPVSKAMLQHATKRKDVSFSLTATLTITYGPATHAHAPKKARLPVKLTRHDNNKSQPQLADHMEKSLSPEILAMSVASARRSGKSATLSRQTTLMPQSKTPRQRRLRRATGLPSKSKSIIPGKHCPSDVQLVDLQAMDLADLSAALLEHPRGPGVEYTERDRKVLRVLFEKKVSRRRQTR